MRNVKVETPISETEVRKKPSPVVDGIPCFRMLCLGRDSVVREAVVERYTVNMYILITVLRFAPRPKWAAISPESSRLP